MHPPREREHAERQPQLRPPRRNASSTTLAGSVSDADYDLEIAAIFSEEATELLEAAQSSFQGIGLTEPRREEFAALKRPLHTLEGWRAHGGRRRPWATWPMSWNR